MNSSVSLPIKAARNKAFLLYSDLSLHPSWSPWLESVIYNKETGISKWTLKQFGIRYTWTAQNVDCESHQICWESLDGLPNKGKVTFSPYESDDGKESSSDEVTLLMTLTISYDLPNLAAAILKGLGSIGDRFIENTLLADLHRFQEKLTGDSINDVQNSVREGL